MTECLIFLFNMPPIRIARSTADHDTGDADQIAVPVSLDV